MKRLLRKKKTYGYIGALVGVAALGLMLVPPSLHAESTGAPSSQAAGRQAIAPTTKLEVVAGTIRTPQQMHAAEAAFGGAPSKTTPIPFRPTVANYQALKQAAAARAPAGGRGSTAVAPNRPVLTKPTLFTNKDGTNETTGGGFYPPDAEGAIGASQFVEIINSHIEVYNKAAPNGRVSSLSLASFFNYNTEALFDPRVLYDPLWNRWVVYAEAFAESTTVQRIFFAISTTSAANGSYCIYNVNVDIFGNNDFWDYGQMGMDQDAVMWTANIFGADNSFKGADMFVLPKARIYNCLGWGTVMFTGLAGTLTPPVVLDQNDYTFLVSPQGSVIYQYALANSSRYPPSLFLWGFVPIPPYALPAPAAQLGTTAVLDTLDGRFVNVSTQTGDSLFQVHTIDLGGFPTPRFYEIDTSSSAVIQSGYFFKSDTSDDFNAHIAANASRDAFVTWSSTCPTCPNQAQVLFSGRRSTDPPGQMAAASVLATSSVALTGNTAGGNLQRWGDYSAVSIDPFNPLRAWIINEKINSASVWGTRFGQIGY